MKTRNRNFVDLEDLVQHAAQMEKISYAMTVAGWNPTDIDGDDVVVNHGEDYFNFSIIDGIVVWYDFTHRTPIAPLDDQQALIKFFRELRLDRK